MDTKTRPIYTLLTRDFRSKYTHRLKMRGWKKVFHANGNKKKARVAILVSDKIDFKMKTVTRDKEVHYIMMKGGRATLKSNYGKEKKYILGKNNRNNG